MHRLLADIIKVVKGKNRKKLKDRVKKVIEKDRIMHNKLAKAS